MRLPFVLVRMASMDELVTTFELFFRKLMLLQNLVHSLQHRSGVFLLTCAFRLP